jgi:hypothetical protein
MVTKAKMTRVNTTTLTMVTVDAARIIVRAD